MNYETFKTSVISSIQEHFGHSATVSVHSIHKNNDIRLDGLIIQEDSVNISPTIYLNDYYEDYLNGIPLSAIFKDILEMYQKNKSNDDMDLSFFTDYDKVKYKIIYKLIHFEKNKELLQDLPHFRFLDLAVVFACLMLDTPGGNATILIHKHHLDFWHITQDQLYELAKKNTPVLLPFELVNMEEILKTMSPEIDFEYLSEKQDTGIPMYVLTNQSKLYGASCILYPNVLTEFSKEKKCDFYIIPSSIHEVLLVPANAATSSENLDTMVQEVNATQVLDEEILSDHVYYFSRELQFVSM